MDNKCTTPVQHAQHLIAGLLQNDSSIEFYGLPNTMEVEWIQNGHSHSFKELSRQNFTILANAFRSNPSAREFMNSQRDQQGKPLSYSRKVELYAYFMFGGLDSQPDLVDGKLMDCENYRHSEDCPSLKFKKIKLNGCALKEREIRMIDLMAEDHKDEVIAMEMGLALSTYNQHKKELFNKTGTHTKPGLLMAAVRQRVARIFNPIV